MGAARLLSRLSLTLVQKLKFFNNALIGAALLLPVSCATTGLKPAETLTSEPLEAYGIPYVDIAANGGIIHSPFDLDSVVDIMLDESVFHDYIIFKLETEYSLYGENKTAVYYVVLFDFEKTIADDAVIVKGTEIGYMGKRSTKLAVFCNTLDPYLIINDSAEPKHCYGWYWFSGGFILSNGSTDWLSFNPVDDIYDVLETMAEHHNELPSFNFYPYFRVRFKTSLSSYPRELTPEETGRIEFYEKMYFKKTGLMEYVNEMDIGAYSFLLCWQNGFLDYLMDEYTLGDDIWLYGSVISYDAFTGKGYIFLRDFSLLSVEEEYEKRLEILHNVE
jgi:hypothetical protein